MNDDNRIKSALELALEKTRGMKASHQEIEALREKETRARLKGLVSKYIDGALTTEELENKIEESDESVRGLVRSAIVEELLAFIELGTDCAAALEGLSAVAGSEVAAHLEKLKALLRDFDAKHSEVLEDYRSKALEALKRRGIWGSGLAPNLRDDEDWRRTSNAVAAACSAELDKARAALLEAVSGDEPS